MEWLLEPPPLLTLLVVLASTGLALWLGTGGHRRPRPAAGAQDAQDAQDDAGSVEAGEVAERWSAPDPLRERSR